MLVSTAQQSESAIHVHIPPLFWTFYSGHHSALSRVPWTLMWTYACGLCFPGRASGKEPTCQCRLDLKDAGSIPGWGRSPGGGHSNPLQYSCLENPMDRRAWWATVHRVAKSQTWLKWLSTQQTCSLCSLEWVSLFSKLTCNHRLTSLNT